MKPSNIIIRQNGAVQPNGTLAYTYSVTFNVGQQGPFTLIFSQPDFTPANVTQRLNEFAAGIVQIAGQPA